MYLKEILKQSCTSCVQTEGKESVSAGNSKSIFFEFHSASDDVKI